MIKWLNSVRAIVVVLMTMGILAGLFANKIGPELFGQIALMVFTAYFAKRDEKKPNDGK